MAIESEHYIYRLFPHCCKTTIFEGFPIATFDSWRSYDHIIYDLRCSNKFMKRIVTCLSSKMPGCPAPRLHRNSSRRLAIPGNSWNPQLWGLYLVRNPLRAPQLSCRIAALNALNASYDAQQIASGFLLDIGWEEFIRNIKWNAHSDFNAKLQT